MQTACLSLALFVRCFLFRCPGSLALKLNHDGNMTMYVDRDMSMVWEREKRKDVIQLTRMENVDWEIQSLCQDTACQ